MTTTAAKVTEGTVTFKEEGETHQTWYKVVGDLTTRSRTPLVVLHGGPGVSHDSLIPLSDLSESANIPVIFYDQVGNGRSTHLRDKPASFWTIHLFIDELVNLLTYFEIDDDFDLIGHSWGGMLATEFEVQRQPAGLKHLILTNSLASMSLWVKSNAQLLQAFPKEVQEGVMGGPGDMKKYREALGQFRAVHACTIKPQPKEIPDTLENFFRNPTVNMAMMGPGGVLSNWTIIDRLHLVRVPTLVINGRADIAQDFVCGPFFWNIQKAKWVTFELSSHFPLWEERERYMKLTGEFLGL